MILQSFRLQSIAIENPRCPRRVVRQLGLISVSLTLQMETGRSKSNNYKL